MKEQLSSRNADWELSVSERSAGTIEYTTVGVYAGLKRLTTKRLAYTKKLADVEGVKI